jgi:hypothetical protein
MMGMSVQIDRIDIAIRLGLSILAGVVIGFDRSEHGKIAGLRTTALVGLAASLAMIQVNLLLSTAGRSPSSFVTMDVMRLPLGILTGVGFIGAGAILRRDEVVFGVTTAATLWLVTVVGLCLGAGQIALADYLIPVNADVEQVDVILLSEEDNKLNPAGVKGLGELGNVGTAAAISNAVYHAIGIRIRELPIRIEKILNA